MAKDIILTGIRPTGALHIGHLAGSLRSNVALQNAGGYDKMYGMIADAQALTDNFDDPGKVHDNVIEVALDMLASGYDPEKSTIFIQSLVPELTELTFYYMNLVSLARVERNPTVKTEIAQKSKFNEGVPFGFVAYPISQTADITAFDATIVPVGEDQNPMLEQAREIVTKFNSIYGKGDEILKMPRAIVPVSGFAARLPGTDGNVKMGKSLGNGIYLKDDDATIAAKIKDIYTDPLHLKIEDPGHTEGNVAFIYLSVFATDEHFAKFLPEYKNYAELAAHYERGGLGDVKVKKFLTDVMIDVITPIRTRREELEKDKAAIMEILRRGTEKARAAAAETLARVKKSMLLNYFD
jgi:tryptophanyl-tRNA synthetase